ncbi:MAG TPA: hypothetical protein VH393_05345 [Ktedonobacterales bacterium]|jgi:hypothetical protein
MSNQSPPTEEQKEQYKANAVAWALQFVSWGVPADLTVADAQIKVRPIRNQVMENTGPLTWLTWEFTVYLRGGWMVELDLQGNPEDPPHKP